MLKVFTQKLFLPVIPHDRKNFFIKSYDYVFRTANMFEKN